MLLLTRVPNRKQITYIKYLLKYIIKKDPEKEAGGSTSMLSNKYFNINNSLNLNRLITRHFYLVAFLEHLPKYSK